MSRRRRRPVLVRDLILMLALFAVVSVLSLAGSLIRSPAVILAVFVLGAGGFFAGRRYERRRRAPSQVTPGIRDKPAAPDPADQIALLEHLAARPISAIIASYSAIQRKYGGNQ
jgi:ABC-type sugar transport system substrate-binding protein